MQSEEKNTFIYRKNNKKKDRRKRNGKEVKQK